MVAAAAVAVAVVHVQRAARAVVGRGFFKQQQAQKQRQRQRQRCAGMGCNGGRHMGAHAWWMVVALKAAVECGRKLHSKQADSLKELGQWAAGRCSSVAWCGGLEIAWHGTGRQ